MKPQEQENSLEKQFSSLEMEWDSIKQSFSTSNGHNTVTAASDSLFRLYENSPKELMSLLQQDNSPYDRAAIEVIKQREAEFGSGRIVGRRLFEDENEEDENDDGKSEVSTVFSWVGSEKRGEIYDEHGGVFIECFYGDGKSEGGSNEKEYGENYEKVCVDSDENDGVFDMDGKSEVSTDFSCVGFEKYGEKYDEVCQDSDENGEGFDERFDIDDETEVNTNFSCIGLGSYSEKYDEVLIKPDENGENNGVFDECFDMNGKTEVSTGFSFMGLEKYGEKFKKVCMDLLPKADVSVKTGAGGSRRHGFDRKRMILVLVMLFAIGIVAFKGQDEQVLVPT